MKARSAISMVAAIALSLGVGYQLGASRSSDPISSHPLSRVQAAVMVTAAQTQKSTPTPMPAAKKKYVLNTSTKKFHKPSCSSVDQMKEKNKRIVDWSREEIIDAGYDPCGRCHP